MTRLLQLVFCGFLSLIASAQAMASAGADALLPLMPYPQQLELQEGQLVLGKQWSLAIKGEQTPALKKALKRFSQRVQQQTGIKIRFNKAADEATLTINVKDTTAMSPRIGDWDESYQLSVSAQNILLEANHQLGVLRGLETLLQLIGTNTKTIHLPLVKIVDFPRFQWRGLLLDSSRHFFSINTIKRQIDAMAAAKYNIFHWHLTDDQGWRFESKRYPKLQKLASDGQFYTRAQMRDVVAYAQARGVQVLPEIDIPGHASAIAVAYPELMSAPGPYQMEYRWGVHKPTLNPANEKVYEFVDALVAEVKEIFPFEYLHIGGDEVDPEHWKTNADIQAFMQEKGIKNTSALQAYFNQRAQTILEKHQRKMIGWDEILHKDLPKNIVIQSWRGPDAVGESVTAGFQAILSTGYYLDQPQRASYHYRNDPLPPAPYIQESALREGSIEKVGAYQSWSFAMPRKRGNPVTGQFTLFKNAAQEMQGFIDFKGKSRREIDVKLFNDEQAIFAIDTWMGPVEFRAKFVGDELKGKAIVGNAPYQLAGKKNAPEELIQAQQPTLLGAQEQRLILGGEAALWAEIVDEHSIDVRLWPRAFVVAERLWSAQNLQDENAMYVRMNAVADWSEKSTGLQHRVQSEKALQKLVKSKDIQAVLLFSQMLEPAHYYHRQHEKSAHESYSKADPLNRLVDALPAENEVLRQFDLRLTQWVINAEDNQDYRVLREQLELWASTQEGLSALLTAQPQLKSVAQKAYQLIEHTLVLLDKRKEGNSVTKNEKLALENQLANALEIEQEMIIALAFSTEKLLNSFSSH